MMLLCQCYTQFSYNLIWSLAESTTLALALRLEDILMAMTAALDPILLLCLDVDTTELPDHTFLMEAALDLISEQLVGYHWLPSEKQTICAKFWYRYSLLGDPLPEEAIEIVNMSVQKYQSLAFEHRIFMGLTYLCGVDWIGDKIIDINEVHDMVTEDLASLISEDHNDEQSWDILFGGCI